MSYMYSGRLLAGNSSHFLVGSAVLLVALFTLTIAPTQGMLTRPAALHTMCSLSLKILKPRTGFLAAALAEIFGAGSILNQFAAGPQLVVITIALIIVSTIIPIQKGTDGNYLRSLLDTYA